MNITHTKVFSTLRIRTGDTKHLLAPGQVVAFCSRPEIQVAIITAGYTSAECAPGDAHIYIGTDPDGADMWFPFGAWAPNANIHSAQLCQQWRIKLNGCGNTALTPVSGPVVLNYQHEATLKIPTPNLIGSVLKGDNTYGTTSAPQRKWRLRVMSETSWFRQMRPRENMQITPAFDVNQNKRRDDLHEVPEWPTLLAPVSCVRGGRQAVEQYSANTQRAMHHAALGDGALYLGVTCGDLDNDGGLHTEQFPYARLPEERKDWWGWYAHKERQAHVDLSQHWSTADDNLSKINAVADW